MFYIEVRVGISMFLLISLYVSLYFIFQAQFKSSFVSAVEQDKSASEENYAAAGGTSQLNAALQPQMIQPSGIGGASRMGLGSEGPSKKKKKSRWD